MYVRGEKIVMHMNICEYGHEGEKQFAVIASGEINQDTNEMKRTY